MNKDSMALKMTNFFTEHPKFGVLMRSFEALDQLPLITLWFLSHSKLAWANRHSIAMQLRSTVAATHPYIQAGFIACLITFGFCKLMSMLLTAAYIYGKGNMIKVLLNGARRNTNQCPNAMSERPNVRCPNQRPIGRTVVLFNLFTDVSFLVFLKCVAAKALVNATDLLWLVFLDDCLTKCIGVATGMIARRFHAAFPIRTPFKRCRKNYFNSFIETSNQLPLGLLPIIAWPGGLMVDGGADLMANKFNMALAAACIGIKVWMIVRVARPVGPRRWKETHEAIKENMEEIQDEATTKENNEEIKEEHKKENPEATKAAKAHETHEATNEKVFSESAAGDCSKSHQDIVNPLMFFCIHIFCKSCAGDWFWRSGDFECPICRALSSR